jgi:predicted O-linked N-acetylglucosamine transferase (SPINDLY family)
LEIGDARLLFKGPAFEQPERQRQVLSVLTGAGVDAARIRFMGGSSWHDHMAAHSNVDIALDPFPYSGGISTAEALWMGIPVIALRGKTASQRTAAAVLKVAGLDGWVAGTPQQYCQIAVEKARGHDGLAALRATLREHVTASAIMNPEIYVRSVERVYLDVWRVRCAKHVGDEAHAPASQDNLYGR